VRVFEFHPRRGFYFFWLAADGAGVKLKNIQQQEEERQRNNL
jgi:hypothetical protein